jgi:hypothetical protein
MTVLGKIFVIVNLLFSLVTAALILMVFVTRTNWKEQFDVLSNRYESLKRSRDALVAEAEEERKAKQQTETALATEQAARKKDAQGHAQALADRDATVRGLQGQLDSTRANLQAATVDLNRRQQEVANLKTVDAGKDKKINELESANKDFRDRAVAAELNYGSEHERNTLLLKQLEQTARDMERQQQPRGGRPAPAGAVAMRYPNLDVRGTVLESDQKTGLVTISLGSDAGLEVGHVLQVYRTDPRPEYVGEIRIVDTHPKQSVGRAVMPLRAGPVKEHDTVASNIR